MAPNDTLYPQQWNLHGTKGLATPEAWKTTQGAGVTVAVIDSGIVKHPDLDANVLPGYDFITEPSIARDGNRPRTPTRRPGQLGRSGRSAVLMRGGKRVELARHPRCRLHRGDYEQ